MAKRKKTKTGGGIGAIIIGLLLFLIAIPREIWMGTGAVIVIGAGVYLYRKSKGNVTNVPQAPVRPASTAPRPRNQVSAKASTTARPLARASSGEATPVRVVASSTPASPSFRIPAAPKGYGPAIWIPAGKVVGVGGISIPGGLIYVGTSLRTQMGGNAPCLIDPSKSVAQHGDYTERQMNYWPSYSDIHPAARRAYLNWLADGRQDPEADIGYVFLFFYGLERRAILDAIRDDAAKTDWPIIATELHRLLDIYGGKSGSFRNYAGSLLDWISLADHPKKTYLRPIPRFPQTYELPLYIRLALGQAAVDGVAVPAPLALAWAKLDPNTRLRTPATRCPEEFDKLFTCKYHETLGQGLILPKNKTKVKLVYRPASRDLLSHSRLSLSFGDTPDVAVLTAPIKKLQQVVEAATRDLEPFSRYVGKNPDARHALEGLQLLPVTLWPADAQKTLHTLKERIGDGLITLSFQALLSSFDARTVFTKSRVLTFAQTLESLNIGIEPDILGGAKRPKPEEEIVLFAIPPGEPTDRSTPAYRMAVLMLDLASAVAATDDDFSVEEMGHLRKRVQSWEHLAPSQIRRLFAHLRLRMTTPVSVVALKTKLEPLDAGAKQTIAVFATAVAQSDGSVSPTEVQMLEKIYKVLNVESSKVFSDLHAVATGAKPATATSVKAEGTGFKLDPERIAALQRDSEMVSALLSNIFDEEENQPEPSSIEPEPEVEAAEPPHELFDLDETHSALARLLLSRPEWTRDELNDAASDLDLMIDGAIEILNDAAFDRYDIPFTEGEDVVTVNPELLEKLAA